MSALELRLPYAPLFSVRPMVARPRQQKEAASAETVMIITYR